LSRSDAKISPNLTSQKLSLIYALIGLNTLWTSQKKRGKVDALKMSPVSPFLSKTTFILSLTAPGFRITSPKSSTEQQSQTLRYLSFLPRSVKRNAVSRMNLIEIKF